MGNDEELMDRAGRGDVEAFGKLFDTYQRPLFGFLFHLVGDATTAEDLVQEVFESAWRYRASYDPRRKLTGWLYAIARRAAFREIKKPHHRDVRFCELSQAQMDRIDAGGAGNPSEFGAAESPESGLAAELRDALQALHPQQRAAILLREYEGRSYREIGEVLACSEGNARVITCRARQALRDLVKDAISERGTRCCED